MVIMTGKMEIRDREAIDHSKNAPEEISELNLQKKRTRNRTHAPARFTAIPPPDP